MRKLIYVLVLYLFAIQLANATLSNPSPFNLTTGNWTLTGWNSGVAAASYPGNGAIGSNTTTGVVAGATNANMVFWTASAGDPTLAATPSANYAGSYSTCPNGSICGNGTSGFYFNNTGGSDIGYACLGLNTTGRTNIQVSWQGLTIASGARQYGIRLQYRVGTTGAFTDANATPSNILYNAGTTGTNQTFSAITLPAACNGVTNLQLVWVYYYIGPSTGTRPQLGINNITISSSAAIPSIAIANNGSQTGIANISQGSVSNVLSTFKITEGGVAAATLNSLAFVTGGTYASTDISNFQLWTNSTNTFPGSSVASQSSSTGHGETITFSSLSQAIPLSGTQYFWLTTDIASGATVNNSVNATAIATSGFTFALANVTGNTESAGGAQTIVAPSPTHYVITSISPNPATAGIGFNVTVQAQDVNNNPANVGSSSSFSLTTNGSAGTIGGTTTGTIASGTNSVTVTGVTLNTAGTGVTVTASNSSGLSLTAATSSTFVVLAAQPVTQATNVTFANVTAGTFDISWTNGSGSTRLVVVRPVAATNVAPANGSAYTANLNIASSGTTGTNNFVVYSGAGSGPVTVSGVAPSTNYSVEVYEFNGSTTTSDYLTTTATNNPNTQTTAIPTYYWNGATPTGTTVSGGSGTWSTVTTNTNWLNASPAGVIEYWPNTTAYDAYFGTATGNVILAGASGTYVTANTVNVGLTGYTFTNVGTTSGYLSTSSAMGIALGNSVNLTMQPNGYNIFYNGNVTQAASTTGGSLTLLGNQSNLGNYGQIELLNTSTISVPVTLQNTAAAQFGVITSGTPAIPVITGNLTLNQQAGAGNFYIGPSSAVTNTLTISGAITGTGNIAVANGPQYASAGGKGILWLAPTIAGQNTFTGNFYMEANSTLGFLRACSASGISGIPSTSGVIWDFAGTGGTLDLYGGNVSINQLAQTAATAAGGISNSGASVATLTINQSTGTTYGTTPTASLVVADGTSKTALTMAGTGTLTLNGANTYTGATTVTAGSLFINNAAGLAAGSAVSVSSGGIIGGSGTAAGTLSLSGTVSPGSSASPTIGNFTTGAQTWNSGAKYKFDISNVSGTAGTNWDLVTSTGAINVSAGSYTIDLTGNPTGFTSSTIYNWTIATGTSITGFNAANFTVTTTNFTPTVNGNFTVTQSGNSLVINYTPTGLAAVPASFTGMTTIQGTASASVNSSLSGTGLSGAAITISAPSNFEVSLDNVTFSSSIILNTGSPATYTGTTLNATTLYIRITVSASLGVVSGNVSISGGGVSTPITISVAGNVLAAQPTLQATNVVFSAETTSTFTVNWSNGDGSSRLVVVRPVSAANVVPVNATAYTVNLNIASSGTTGTNNFVVYSGTGTGPITVTGLTASTNYSVEVYEFNGTTTSINYLTTTATQNPNTQTTASPVYYWNGGTPTAGSGVTANGGTGTWTTTNAWVEPTTPGTGATWVDGNLAVAAGTAGTISIANGTTVTPVSTTFKTTGYVLTPAGTTTSIIAGSISLDPSVNLTIIDPAQTTGSTLSTGSISGGTGSGITIAGAGTSGNNSRLNLAQANAILSVPVNIACTGSATAYAGIVGTASGTSVTGNINNTGTEPTMIGATSGNSMAVSGNITGSTGVLFAAGASGGAGTITLSGTNTYSGITNVNNTASGLIKCGATNTLSPNSVLNLGFSSTNGSPVDLNGFDQTIGGLSSGAGTGSITNGAAGTGTNTLTIGQNSNTTFGLIITNGATAKTTVVKSGSGTLGISGANTFTGGLTLSAGTLQMTGAGNLLPGTLAVTFNGGTFSTGPATGYTETVGTLSVTDNSTISFGTSSHKLNFANSSAIGWTTGKTLTITGWAGTAGNSGTAGQLFVGNNNSGLTSGQLAQITFTGFNPGAIQLSTGEVVPASASLVVDQTGFISAFGNVNLGSASAQQSFVVSGISLDPTVVITPPAGYQISLTSGSGFQTGAITLNTTSGVLANTTIYVEFIPTVSGAANGNITVVSGTVTRNVAVTGTGVLATIYSQISGVAATSAMWSYLPVGTAQTITSLGGFSSTTNVVIQARHTVTTSVSQEIKTKDLTINSGGVLKELVTSSSTPYYLAIYGNLTVDGQLGALTGADSIGLDIDGATSTISGSGTINLQRIRNNVGSTSLSIDADVNLWWIGASIYNNVASSTFNVTVNAGKTVNLEGQSDVSVNGIAGATSGRGGIYTVNGTVTGIDTVYGFASASAFSSSGIVIGSGGLVSANFVKIGIGGTGNFSFAVNAGGELDVNNVLQLQTGTFSPAGLVLMKSTSSSQVAIIDNFSSGSFTGTYSGSITAERYFDASLTYNQHYMGSPVNAPALSQFGASGTPGFVTPQNCSELELAHTSDYGTVFSMHESNGASCSLAQWKVETSGSAQNGLGYSVLVSGAGTISLTGTPNLSSSYTLSSLTNSGWSNTTLQNRSYQSGWQLVSNPYLATLDITTTPGGFDNQIQVWNANGPYAGSYQAGTVIAPFQAFMVHMSNPGTGGTYTVNASSRVITPHTFYALNANQLNIVAKNVTTGLLDQVTVGFDPAATDAFDPQIDAGKVPGALNRHTIYALNNDLWMSKDILSSIAADPAVNVGFEPGATGTYTLTFNGVSTFDPTSYITLEDTRLNTFTNVRNGGYTFTADSADSWNRFVLHFTPPAVVNTTSATCGSAGVINIQQPGTAQWIYILTDTANAIVTGGTLNSSNQVSVEVSAGTYTLTLIDTNNYSVTKTIFVTGQEMVTADFQVSGNTVQVGQSVILNAVTSGASNYQWEMGNGTTATGLSATTSYTQSGTYTVSLVVSNTSGCSATKTQTITVTAGATGFNNINNNEGINIWSHDNLIYVDYSATQPVNSSITVYDILGQEISRETVNSKQVYVKEMNNIDAAYFIVMVRNDDKIITRKVFITNSK
jgi:autotransporter-associated beta strand protein